MVMWQKQEQSDIAFKLVLAIPTVALMSSLIVPYLACVHLHHKERRSAA